MSIEQAVKAQFAKVFRTSDWSLFKKIAEANLRGGDSAEEGGHAHRVIAPLAR